LRQRCKCGMEIYGGTTQIYFCPNCGRTWWWNYTRMRSGNRRGLDPTSVTEKVAMARTGCIASNMQKSLNGGAA